MKRFLLFTIAMQMLLAGCVQNLELLEPSEQATRVDARDAVSEICTRSLEGAVYNEVVDAWMVPQKDPYTLENFQKAYDNLAAEKSAQTLSKAQFDEFTAAKKLQPTHYALKIYPKNEDEQWKVEMMEDVDVVYIPFNYSRLTQEETEMIRTKSAENTFAEKSPYTVTYENEKVTGGGPTGPVTYQLPILYTVWPIDKPLPEDLEYVVDYEVFLPRAATLTNGAEALEILENEAVSAALDIAPVRIMPVTKAAVTLTVSGTMKTYENTTGISAQNVPMPNLKLRYALGSNTTQTATNANGYFSFNISVASIPPGFKHLFYAVFQDPQGRWKITTASSTAPFEGTALSTLTPHTGSNPLGDVIMGVNNRQANEIHRAVNYFYNNQTVFAKPGGMRIIANSSSNSDAEGSFSYPSCDINIYNNGRTKGHVIGTTLHEIGHFIHYKNSSSRYGNTPKFLREAFSSYTGWYLGENYYSTLGWINHNNGTYIAGDNRNDWYKTSSGIYSLYSPLLIDLVDGYNQGATTSFYPDDEIQEQSFLTSIFIWTMVKNNSSWAQFKQSIIGWVEAGYYNQGLRDYLANYDYWFANNPITY